MSTGRLESKRSRLPCAVLLQDNEAVRQPSKKLIAAALSEPCDGCLGNILRESDYFSFSLLPGQWLTDNVSDFAVMFGGTCLPAVAYAYALNFKLSLQCSKCVYYSQLSYRMTHHCVVKK